MDLSSRNTSGSKTDKLDTLHDLDKLP